MKDYRNNSSKNCVGEKDKRLSQNSSEKNVNLTKTFPALQFMEAHFWEKNPASHNIESFFITFITRHKLSLHKLKFIIRTLLAKYRLPILFANIVNEITDVMAGKQTGNLSKETRHEG